MFNKIRNLFRRQKPIVTRIEIPNKIAPAKVIQVERVYPRKIDNPPTLPITAHTRSTITAAAVQPSASYVPDVPTYNPLLDPLNPISPLNPVSPMWHSDPTPAPSCDHSSGSSYDYSSSSSSYDSGSSFDSGSSCGSSD